MVQFKSRHDSKQKFPVTPKSGLHSSQASPSLKSGSIKPSPSLKKQTTSRNQLMSELGKMFPQMHLRESEEFDGRKGGIWTSGEEPPYMKVLWGSEMIELPIFNYWSENYELYDGGVLKEFEKILDKNGWHAEWYDTGTMFLWRD